MAKTNRKQKPKEHQRFRLPEMDRVPERTRSTQVNYCPVCSCPVANLQWFLHWQRLGHKGQPPYG
jgi:hypothetical protein